jgi:hypothetical protein
MSEFVQTQEHPSKTPEMGVWHPVKVSVQLVHVQGQAEGQLYQAREDRAQNWQSEHQVPLISKFPK